MDNIIFSPNGIGLVWFWTHQIILNLALTFVNSLPSSPVFLYIFTAHSLWSCIWFEPNIDKVPLLLLNCSCLSRRKLLFRNSDREKKIKKEYEKASLHYEKNSTYSLKKVSFSQELTFFPFLINRKKLRKYTIYHFFKS